MTTQTAVASPKDVQNFLEAEQRFRRITYLFNSGSINETEATEAHKKNMVLFDNEWWAIGLDSGKWHKYVNNEWVMETPPFVI